MHKFKARVGMKTVAKQGWSSELAVNDQIIGPVAEYTGQLATRSFIPTGIDLTNKQANSRTHHRARSIIRQIQIELPAWYWARSGAKTEVNVTGNISYRASVEYPKGVFTQLKFAGAVSGLATGAVPLVSDALIIKIPRNAKFWIRTYAVGTHSTVFSDTSPGSALVVQDQNPDCDSYEYGTSITDKTMGGEIVNTDPLVTSRQLFPQAIFGPTTWPTVLMIGDSKCRGFGDTYDSNGDMGEFGRSLGPYFGYINAGSSGDSLSEFIASSTRRQALKQYCSNVIVQTAINALRSGTGQNKTAAAVLVEQQTILGYFADKRRLTCTTAGSATSNASFTTLASQTLNSNNAEIILWNDAQRALVSGSSWCFDIQPVFTEGLNLNRWKVDGTAFKYTVEGLHPTRFSYDLLAASGVVDRTKII